MSHRIRVLLADDSPTMLDALAACLADEASIEVVGRARDGMEAVEKAIALRPDVITMDVLMPRLDGLGATAAIMAEAPARILVVASVTEDRQQDLSFRAISAGALEVIPKPGAGTPLPLWGERLAAAVRLMSEVPVVRRRRLPPRGGPQLHGRGGQLDAFGLAASTGGPPALADLLSALPGDLPVPVLVAQHLAPGFTTGLVRWLSEVTPLQVRVAGAGEAARPGVVYLAPDACHLEIDAEGLLVTARGSGAGHCPSGDRLLTSLARAYGARCGGAVLTGMGEDGARGLLEIRRAGGLTFAQDEESSVVFGMPGAARALGAVDQLVSIPTLAAVLCDAALGREVPKPQESP